MRSCQESLRRTHTVTPHHTKHYIPTGPVWLDNDGVSPLYLLLPKWQGRSQGTCSADLFSTQAQTKDTQDGDTLDETLIEQADTDMDMDNSVNSDSLVYFSNSKGKGVWKGDLGVVHGLRKCLGAGVPISIDCTSLLGFTRREQALCSAQCKK